MLTHFVQPLGLLWCGVLVLGFRLGRRGDRSGAALGFFLVAALTLIGGTPFSGLLLGGVERPYLSQPSLAVGSADAILVLGGGHRFSRLEPAGFEAQAGFDRSLAGVTLAVQGVATNLVFGGGSKEVDGKFVELGGSQVNWWSGLLPDGVRLGLVDSAYTTREEALRMRELASRFGWSRIVLVSSAWHLRRATAAFANVGLKAIPVGCDFEGLARLEDRPGFTVVPTLGDLGLFGRWVYEMVGWWYYRLRGWG